MNRTIILIACTIMAGCAAQKQKGSSGAGVGDTRNAEVQFINENTYLLTEVCDDKTYGYKESNPVKVGGIKESSGPRNERRFLNALLGPNGEEVTYFRAGSCCYFKTPNGIINNTGLLDKYRVTWSGSLDTLDIYFNMYDEGDLMIPVGFTAKKRD